MPLTVVRTNLPRDKIQYDFMEQMADATVKILECEKSLTMVEMHTDVQMLRSGSRDPTVNLYVYHNEDKITEQSKQLYGARFAEVLFGLLNIGLDRVLVLFFDTRQTIAPAPNGIENGTKF